MVFWGVICSVWAKQFSDRSKTVVFGRVTTKNRIGQIMLEKVNKKSVNILQGLDIAGFERVD